MGFSDFEIYKISLIAFGAVGLLSCFWLWTVKPENVQVREKLARARYAGLVIAFFDLLWCIPHSKPLLPVSMHDMLLPAVFVCAFLAWAFLDYLFSRAIGGFMILLAYYFLHESFTFHSTASQVFACFCFAMGIAGIFFSGKPYLFRDMFRIISTKVNLKITIVAALFAFSALSLALGVLHIFPGKI